MENKKFLAIDIGASSGRHIVGCKRNGEFETDEVFRFDNGVTRREGRLCWNIEALVAGVVKGIKKAFEKYPELCSISIDTWGVDYVLMKDAKPVLPCYSYRDDRTEPVIDKVHALVPFEKLYEKTGIQFQPFNTVYQLYADKLAGRLDGVTDFLMIPEYLAYRLTGVKKKEYTNATTTGLVNASTCAFDKDIVCALGLPEGLFGEVYAPGETVGMLTPELAREVKGNAPVVLCASHDTASAVEGIPMTGDALYISSGTWSLLGVKSPVPLTDENSRKANYSNEGGVGYIRYQKNIMGMWVVNELKRELCPFKPFAEIVEEAINSGLTATVDINDERFLAPKSMKAAFDGALVFKPTRPADYFNCAFLSLAQSYKTAIAELEANTGRTYSELYIVGGGAKNRYLNALTARATGKKVIALPIEATAIGNLKIQAQKEA